MQPPMVSPASSTRVLTPFAAIYAAAVMPPIPEPITMAPHSLPSGIELTRVFVVGVGLLRTFDWKL